VADRTLSRYAEILRSDFAGFAHRAFLELYPSRSFERNWHIDVLVEKLEAVRCGKNKRLIINVPPRSLKSFLGSIAFPAFVLGHNPSAEILCTSYGQDFANDLALPCRSLMLSPFYKALFSTRLSEDRQAVEEFKTTVGGARRAISWAGAVMGRGADLIIIDDPLKADEALSETRRNAINETFHTSIGTRLNRDSGAIILIMQRLHANDLTAFVQKGERWDVIAIPSIAERNETYDIRSPVGRRVIRRLEGQVLQPQRQSLKSLTERRNAGARIFDAQFQQRPHAAEGAIIQREWLAYYDDNTKPKEFDVILQSWDTASKPGESNSYNVCSTWGIRENRFYLVNVFRQRIGFRELKARAIGLAREYRPTSILVEEQSFGSPLMAELGQLGFPVQAVPTGNASKADRLYAHSNKFEGTRVFLPRQVSWLDVYIDELTSFPDSDFSDQVDSTSQALTWDTSSSNFNNAITAMGMLSGGNLSGSAKTIKLLVLEGGGRIMLLDRVIDVPETGKILEIDYEVGAELAGSNWKKYRIVPDD
jgi:predicted phage terminase large subunit-like protein